ncbi:hypothetical protein JYU34_008738 [Plutella xylostella]|uniref:Transcription initiation factor TFIID subunit 6 n=1 Tax=Plutella xylostella TaxID=51655 RepID=A0ABQ7QLN8_PLUXY|nr:hypothetical protein JYU34_008738 [Plutella xylostella]
MSNSTSLKTHSKKVNSSRDRDKNRSVASESGGSSQCDTPPLIEKDGASSSSQGKYAGIGVESVQCMAEQVGAEITTDAATNLAEDVSYKLRQIIHTIAARSELMMKSQVDAWDVNTTLMLSDTSPVVGACTPHYVTFGEEELCCQVETLQNVTECAMTTQSYVYASLPTLSVEWITDEKSVSSNSNLSVPLQNYYTKVARAILNLKKKLKDIAVQDLTTNTRIGPIFPNLFNLAVLVLNDDNLKALNVPAKKPLQCNVLDMMDALCSNPCSLDTNIQQQFQRLFPVMVSNILSNGSLSEKMVAVLTKITRTWPSFASMGKEILFDYLSKGPKTQLTAQMIKCLTALGRPALIECVSEHLDYIDEVMNEPRKNHIQLGLRETSLDASTCLLRSELTTYLEDYVATDYTLYEMLGDSVMPRRTLFPIPEPKKPPTDATSQDSQSEDEMPYLPFKTLSRRSKVKLFPRNRILESSIHREAVFEPVRFKPERILCRIPVKVKSFRNLPVKKDRAAQAHMQRPIYNVNRSVNGVAVACGLLNRFRYRLNNNCKPFPIFGTYML